MMEAFKTALKKACSNDHIQAIIFTAEGKYFSAGVNLSSAIKLMHPKKLRDAIIEHNYHLFDAFINVNKPILIAINGHAIGASVTAATLCDHIIAAEEASFSTPFAALGVTPEGCSSIHFPRLIGDKHAQRMLGDVGWKPTAQQACAIGLIQQVVPKDKLHLEAMQIARDWVKNGKKRSFLAGSTPEELKQANQVESKALANAFLSQKFLNNQAHFLWRKKKWQIALVFYLLSKTRILWSRLL